MSVLGDIWQTLHQGLSDPALQGIGTVISIAGSGIALLKSKSSKQPTNSSRQRETYLKKTFKARGNACLKRLPMLSYGGSSLNDF